MGEVLTEVQPRGADSGHAFDFEAGLDASHFHRPPTHADLLRRAGGAEKTNVPLINWYLP